MLPYGIVKSLDRTKPFNLGVPARLNQVGLHRDLLGIRANFYHFRSGAQIMGIFQCKRCPKKKAFSDG